MALVGYTRVSSVGQSLEVQRDKLKDCEKVFEEQKSGTSDQPPRLKACLEYVRPGDTLVVTRLDRLARSTLHLCQMADKLQGKAEGRRTDQGVDGRLWDFEGNRLSLPESGGQLGHIVAIKCPQSAIFLLINLML